MDNTEDTAKLKNHQIYVPKIWQKMNQSLVQLALIPIFKADFDFRVPQNYISGTRSITKVHAYYIKYIYNFYGLKMAKFIRKLDNCTLFLRKNKNWVEYT